INADNEKVPYALVPYDRLHVQQLMTEKSKPVVIFPVQQDSANNAAVTAIQLDSKDNKTSIQMTSQTEVPSSKSYYLFDMGKQHPAFNKLTLDWDGHLGKLIILDILTSNNLKDWQHVGETTLLKTSANNETVLKNSVSFEQDINAQFMQIKPKNTTETFSLKSASLQFNQVEETELPIDWQDITLMHREETDKSVHIEFESDGRYPARYLNIQLPQQNTITNVSIHVRNNTNQSWSHIKNAPVYRLKKDGKYYTNKPVQITKTAARYWRLSFDIKNGGIGHENPKLSLGWLPDTLIWNARGLAPYQLLIGEDTKTTNLMNINDLIRPYDKLRLSKLPFSSLTLVSSNQQNSSWETPKNNKRIWLWAGLFIGVIALASMAYSLFRSKPEG
ncbi:MAG TPA: DUF3999 family protein, partial [Methylophilaceae bacterium]|nr:DUF3999 family protein [Methylophilaceae bacterium]